MRISSRTFFFWFCPWVAIGQLYDGHRPVLNTLATSPVTSSAPATASEVGYPWWVACAICQAQCVVFTGVCVAACSASPLIPFAGWEACLVSHRKQIRVKPTLKDCSSHAGLCHGLGCFSAVYRMLDDILQERIRGRLEYNIPPCLGLTIPRRL